MEHYKDEGPINRSRNIHTYPPGSLKDRNCTETQVAPKVLHKLTKYSYIFISSCIYKINHKWDIARFTAVGI